MADQKGAKLKSKKEIKSVLKIKGGPKALLIASPY